MAHRYLIIGLGSMGNRRIRNLLALRVRREKIFGFDVNPERCKEIERTYAIKASSDLKEAIRISRPSAFIISTPPDKHAPYFLYAARRKIHFFVEVTTVDTGYKKLIPLLRDNVVAAPSCTFRYVPAIQKIKKLIDAGAIGRPLYFRHYLGQYLPDWHPYEDYRKVYFAKKETGGAREMFPYELIWLNYILGSELRHIAGIITKVSDLDISADDIYAAVVQYKNGIVGSLQIDLLNRKAERTLEVVGTKGVLEWNWLLNTLILSAGTSVEHFKLSAAKRLAHYNTTENIYVAEMMDFISAIEGRKPFPYSFEDDWKILRALHALEKGKGARTFLR